MQNLLVVYPLTDDARQTLQSIAEWMPDLQQVSNDSGLYYLPSDSDGLLNKELRRSLVTHSERCNASRLKNLAYDSVTKKIRYNPDHKGFFDNVFAPKIKQISESFDGWTLSNLEICPSQAMQSIVHPSGYGLNIVVKWETNDEFNNGSDVDDDLIYEIAIKPITPEGFELCRNALPKHLYGFIQQSINLGLSTNPRFLLAKLPCAIALFGFAESFAYEWLKLNKAVQEKQGKLQRFIANSDKVVKSGGFTKSYPDYNLLRVPSYKQGNNKLILQGNADDSNKVKVKFHLNDISWEQAKQITDLMASFNA